MNEEAEILAAVNHSMMCRILSRQPRHQLQQAADLLGIDLAEFLDEHAEEITFEILKG